MNNPNTISQLIEISESKCKLCYACVRVCPVKAIEVKVNKPFAKILENRCVGCGHCYTVCPYDAISYRDSKEEAKKLLKSENKTIAIVAPSISGEFDDITDYRKFVKMIKTLGFSDVYEASFGADLVGKKYADLLENFKGKYYISSNCPAITSIIEKFHPELINNLAPIISPMVATAKVIRKKLGNDINIVYIGPCIAAKDEALLLKECCRIDSVLTFTELRELFKEFNITEKTLEFSDFTPPYGNKGALYPLSNGILKTGDINEDPMTGDIITAEGRNDILEAIKKFGTSIDIINKHFNLFYCEGCLMGPGTSKEGNKFIRRSLVTKYANKRAKDFDEKEWEKNIEENSNIDFRRGFINNDQRIVYPPENKIQEILNMINRAPAHDDSGCGICGYDSCREFAVAVSKGLAKTEMCLTYSLSNKHDYINTLKATNEKLNKTKEALKESEEIAQKEKKTAKEASDIISSMLQKLKSGVVIVDKELKILQSNKSFIETLGEEAIEINEIIPGLIGADIKTLVPYNIQKLFSYVLTSNEDIFSKDIHIDDKLLNISLFPIRKNKIVGAIIRDMHSPEVRREEVISRVSDVINKNLELVQQIGFILGEGAAETEQMLNSIIETYKSEKK